MKARIVRYGFIGVVAVLIILCGMKFSNMYKDYQKLQFNQEQIDRGLSKIDILHTVSIPQLARTIPLKGLNLSLEKYRMPDGVIIEVESSSHYLGSFSEKNDSSTNWIEKIMEGVGIH